MKIDKDILITQISKNLRELRIKHKHTQEFVADAINVDVVTYQRYESSKIKLNISIYNLYKLAHLYNVTLDSLIK